MTSCYLPAGCFLALTAAGHTGGPRVHYGASLRPGRPLLHVLWAFSVTWAGSFSWDSRSATPSHPGPDPAIPAFLRSAAAITPFLQLSSSQLCGSHDTTEVAHQAPPFATATAGAPVCACEACFLSSYEIGTKTYCSLKSGPTNCTLGKGAGRYKPTPRDFKSNRAVTVQRQQRYQQQRYNST